MFCCTVVLMAVSTSVSDLFTESVRALYCSFILFSVSWRFSLSSGLRLSPFSARSSSTERIASDIPSRLVWRSFCTSWRMTENRFLFGKGSKHVHQAENPYLSETTVRMNKTLGEQIKAGTSHSFKFLHELKCQ